MLPRPNIQIKISRILTYKRPMSRTQGPLYSPISSNKLGMSRGEAISINFDFSFLNAEAIIDHIV